MSRRRFVDTNVLVYLFDRGEPAKRDRALQVLHDGKDDGLVLSTQVLQEFYVTVTRKLEPPLAVDEALGVVRELSAFPIVQVDSDLIAEAIVLSRDHSISFWDALILRAAVRGGCSEILTEDLQAGWKLEGLEVVNPFS